MSDPAADLIDFIQKQIIRRPNVRIAIDTPLVSSGLIDSFSLVDVLAKLEEVTATRIPAGKVQPKDMDTVSLMLSTAQRAGKPKG
jgi:acyl carrier protein